MAIVHLMKMGNLVFKTLHDTGCVDFVTIDIEGKDLEVLKLIEISKMRPTIILIEAPFFLKKMRNEIKEYLKNNKYKIINSNKLNLLFLRR